MLQRWNKVACVFRHSFQLYVMICQNKTKQKKNWYMPAGENPQTNSKGETWESTHHAVVCSPESYRRTVYLSSIPNCLIATHREEGLSFNWHSEIWFLGTSSLGSENWLFYWKTEIINWDFSLLSQWKNFPKYYWSFLSIFNLSLDTRDIFAL